MKGRITFGDPDWGTLQPIPVALSATQVFFVLIPQFGKPTSD
jgi:hypothetical protein